MGLLRRRCRLVRSPASELLSVAAVAVQTVRGCRTRHGRAVQHPPGLGRHGSTPCGRRTLRTEQGTRGLASCALSGKFISAIGRVSRGLMGRTGDHPSLTYPYPAGPTNCLARTRSTGFRRGAGSPTWRGGLAQAVSLRSTGSRGGPKPADWRGCRTQAVFPPSTGYWRGAKPADWRDGRSQAGSPPSTGHWRGAITADWRAGRPQAVFPPSPGHWRIRGRR